MQERAKFVPAIGEELKKRLPLLTDVWTAQVGAPKSFAGYVINYGPQLFEFYGQLGAKGDFAETRDVMGGKARSFANRSAWSRSSRPGTLRCR